MKILAITAEARAKNTAYKKEWRRKNPQRARQTDRTHRLKNLDKHREQSKAGYTRNRDTILKRNVMYGKRRINMAGTISLSLWDNPRTGICSKCPNKVGNGCKRTSMHHALGYITILPWFGLVELCNSCHRKIS